MPREPRLKNPVATLLAKWRAHRAREQAINEEIRAIDQRRRDKIRQTRLRKQKQARRGVNNPRSSAAAPARASTERGRPLHRAAARSNRAGTQPEHLTIVGYTTRHISQTVTGTALYGAGRTRQYDREEWVPIYAPTRLVEPLHSSRTSPVYVEPLHSSRSSPVYPPRDSGISRSTVNGAARRCAA